MKVRVERAEHLESTLVIFEIHDHDIADAERTSAERRILRPPRLDLGRFSNVVPRDWIQYIAWLSRIQLTF